MLTREHINMDDGTAVPIGDFEGAFLQNSGTGEQYVVRGGYKTMLAGWEAFDRVFGAGSRDKFRVVSNGVTLQFPDRKWADMEKAGPGSGGDSAGGGLTALPGGGPRLNMAGGGHGGLDWRITAGSGSDTSAMLKRYAPFLIVAVLAWFLFLRK